MANCTGLLNLTPFGVPGFKSQCLRNNKFDVTTYLFMIPSIKKVANIFKKKAIIQIIVLVALFLISTFIHIKFLHYSYDIDEYFSVKFAQTINFSSYYQLIDEDLGNPGFFYLLLTPLVHFSTNEVFLRIIPLTFFFLSGIVFYLLLIKMKLSLKQIFFALIIFFGLGPYQYLRFYLRPYSLLLLLIFLTIFLSYLVLKKNKFFLGLGLAIIITIGFHTHFIFWLFLFFWLITLFSLLIKKQKNYNQSSFLKSLFVSLILNAPIILHLIYREIFTNQKYNFFQLDYRWPQFSGWLAIILKFDFLTSLPQFFSLIVWIVFFIVSIWTYKQEIDFTKKAWLKFTIIICCFYFFTPIHNYFSHAKYFVFLLPFVTTTIILSIITLFKKFKLAKKHVLKFSFVFYLLLLLWMVKYPSNKYRLEVIENWKQALNEIKISDPAIIINNCNYMHVINYYAHKKNEIFSTDKNQSCYLPNSYFNLLNNNQLVVIDRWSLRNPLPKEYSFIKIEKYGIIYVGYLSKR